MSCFHIVSPVQQVRKMYVLIEQGFCKSDTEWVRSVGDLGQDLDSVLPSKNMGGQVLAGRRPRLLLRLPLAKHRKESDQVRFHFANSFRSRLIRVITYQPLGKFRIRGFVIVSSAHRPPRGFRTVLALATSLDECRGAESRDDAVESPRNSARSRDKT